MGCGASGHKQEAAKGDAKGGGDAAAKDEEPPQSEVEREESLKKQSSLMVHDIDERPHGEETTALLPFDAEETLGTEWVDAGNGMMFRGMVINGQPSGFGNARYKNGDLYDGEYDKGKMHGWGHYKFRNGDRYHGRWNGGVSEGIGCYMFHEYGRYVGAIENGQMHGFGTFLLNNGGGEYVGHWRGGVRHGVGYSVTNGCSYEGDWRSGKEEGVGLAVDRRSVYYGAWSDGLRHGLGVCIFSGKRGQQRYLCEYKKGQRTLLVLEGSTEAQKLLQGDTWREMYDAAEEELLNATNKSGPSEDLTVEADKMKSDVDNAEAYFAKQLDNHNLAYGIKVTSPVASAAIPAAENEEMEDELRRLRSENHRLRAVANEISEDEQHSDAVRYRALYEKTYEELQRVKQELSTARAAASQADSRTRKLSIVGKLRAARDRVVVNTATAFKSAGISATMQAAKAKTEEANQKIQDLQQKLDLLTSEDNKFVTEKSSDLAAVTDKEMAEVVELRQKLELAEAHAQEFKEDREAKEELMRARDEMQATIRKLQSQMTNETDLIDKMQVEMAAMTEKHEQEMREEKERLSSQLAQYGSEIEKAKTELAEVKGQGLREAEQRAALEEQMEEIAQQKQELEMGYREERMMARKLRNDLEDMKGQIRVYVRTRPMNQVELAETKFGKCLNFDDDCTVSLDPEAVGKKGDKKVYSFNRAFDEGDGQDEIFEETENLIGSAIDGYNVCIFAYGQTGSGKTWTLTGTEEQPGVARRSITEIFRSAEKVRNRTWEISCYMFEIYNDKVDDLLDTSKKDLVVKKDKKGVVSIVGITERTCATPQELYAYFEDGLSSRKVRGTRMNAASSRSHMCLSIKITINNPEDNSSTLGKFTICDLAGSERMAKTQLTDKEGIKEAKAINQSLSVLGNVISALAKKEKHVPYRDSKLTQVMSDSLGGNAKTLMFVNISPSGYNYDETVSSLNYAQRVKLITNNAQKTIETDEIKRLKKKIAELKAMKGAADDEDEDLEEI